MGAKLRKKIRLLAHYCIKYVESDKFYLIYILLFLAIVAGQNAVSHMKMGSHGLIVGNTLGIVAFDNADNLVRGIYRLFLNNLVVANNAEDNLGGYHGQT